MSRLVPGATLAAWQDEGRAPLVRRVFEDGAALRAVEVASLECDRHREPLTRAELDAWGWREGELDARLARDAEEVTFRARVALQRDGAGRAVLLAQGPELGSAALRDDWMRALGALADAPVDLAWAQATSPHALVAWEAEADADLIARVRSVDAMLDPTGRRDADALTAPRPLRPATPRGRFVRLDAP